MKYTGGCHCKAVRFEVEADEVIEVEDCNCSVCSKSGHLHLIVPKTCFSLLTDEQELYTYTFNSCIAQHYFCKTCGIKSFYIPRSNPDGVDVNVRCLDYPPKEIKIVNFDGKNWEKNAHTLVHKSKQKED
ncbi:GFA family protein [Thalassotalea atypica]|uniref:GFA family protein n=1 Tax=Thalassotalea atypica TaxID=2054316 RepID=UPI00257407C4|nr:GFA family protein [Thalassotalea atypica]